MRSVNGRRDKEEAALPSFGLFGILLATKLFQSKPFAWMKVNKIAAKINARHFRAFFIENEPLFSKIEIGR
jgi:hypothetical protein